MSLIQLNGCALNYVDIEGAAYHILQQWNSCPSGYGNFYYKRTVRIHFMLDSTPTYKLKRVYYLK